MQVILPGHGILGIFFILLKPPLTEAIGSQSFIISTPKTEINYF